MQLPEMGTPTELFKLEAEDIEIITEIMSNAFDC